MSDHYRIVGLAGRGAVPAADGAGEPEFEPFLADLTVSVAVDGEPDLPALAHAAAAELRATTPGLRERTEAVAQAALALPWVEGVEVRLHRPEMPLGVFVQDVECVISRGHLGPVGEGTDETRDEVAPAVAQSVVAAPVAAEAVMSEPEQSAVVVDAGTADDDSEFSRAADDDGAPSLAADDEVQAASEAAPEGGVPPAAVPWIATGTAAVAGAAAAPALPTPAWTPVSRAAEPDADVAEPAEEVDAPEDIDGVTENDPQEPFEAPEHAEAAEPIEEIQAPEEIDDAAPPADEVDSPEDELDSPGGGATPPVLEASARAVEASAVNLVVPVLEPEPAISEPEPEPEPEPAISEPEPEPEPEPAGPVAAVVVLRADDPAGAGDLAAALTALRERDGVVVTGVSPLARTVPDGRERRTAVAGLEVEGPLGQVAEQLATGHREGVSVELISPELPDGEATPGQERAAHSAAVLLPWAQLDPDAVLPGPEGGAVAHLAESAPDRAAVKWLALDWAGNGEAARPAADDAAAPADD